MFVPDYGEDVENDHQSVSTSYKGKSSPVGTGTSGKQPRVSESRIRSLKLVQVSNHQIQSFSSVSIATAGRVI